MGCTRARLVPFLVVATLAAAGCGGGATGEDGGDEAGWIIALLDRIPAGGAPADAAVVDVAAAAAAAGIGVPGAGASDEAIAAFFSGLPRDAVPPSLLTDPFPDFGALRTELGLDPARVVRVITAGLPDSSYQVLEGDFDAASIDAASIDAAVHADPVWSDLLAEAEHRGVAFYAWGEDFQIDVSRVTPVRRLGRGGRLALDGRFLYWVPWTGGLEVLIDAGAGAVGTLADDSRFTRTARALEAQGVYSAVIGDRLLDGGDSGRALGLGGGRDQEGSFWVMVAVHDTDAGAEAAAAEVRAVLTGGTIAATGGPWSERVAGFEVTVEGDMLVVVARAAAGEGDWQRAYYTRDPLVLAAAG